MGSGVSVAGGIVLDGLNLQHLTIHIFSVSNLDDQDSQILVLDCVDDSIITLSNAIEIILSLQLLYTMRARILLKLLEPAGDSYLKGFFESLELTFCGRCKADRVGFRSFRDQVPS